MTAPAVCCSPGTNVGAAVELLWSCNWGMLRVVGPDNGLMGVVTERDISIALGTRNRLLGEVAWAKSQKPMCLPASLTMKFTRP